MPNELYSQMSQSIIDGDCDLAADLAHQALSMGVNPLSAITDGFVEGVNKVGESFSRGEAFLPELVMAGEAMKAAVAVLEPEMHKQGSERKMLGKIVLATVEGEIHEIGKSLVGTMLSAAGFEIHDLGVNVPTRVIIDKACEVNADIIGLSALLTTTMIRQADVIETLIKEGIREKIIVMVGGAPVTHEWVDKIKADGYSEDAIGAVSLARSLMRKRGK